MTVVQMLDFIPDYKNYKINVYTEVNNKLICENFNKEINTVTGQREVKLLRISYENINLGQTIPVINFVVDGSYELRKIQELFREQVENKIKLKYKWP